MTPPEAADEPRHEAHPGPAEHDRGSGNPDRGPGRAPHDEAAESDADEERDQPQRAWDTRRDLYRHSPGIMLGDAASVNGSVVGGDQHAVSGGHVTGDVYLGGRTEVHLATDATVHASGEIPQPELDRLAAVWSGQCPGDDVFSAALDSLRTEHVVVLCGTPSTGRRAAALMLLRRLGATPVRALDPTVTTGRLRDQLTGARGYVLCDLATGRDRPLREHHLRAVAETLRGTGSYLVITTGPQPVIDGVLPQPWRAPDPEAVLRAHLRHLLRDPDAESSLLGLPATVDFLAHDHRLTEVAGFARALARHHASGGDDTAHLEQYGLETVAEQVREWFDDTDASLHDKAFLVSLAAFDGAPFPLTAELSDELYARLQQTEDPALPPRIPVFGPSTANRLGLARAETREELEDTEWGPVQQKTATFRNRLIPLELLQEVWTGHPSARPGLVGWLRRLADDDRPLVRTRAAATAAVFAYADLPSAMALLIGRWASARRYRLRVAAVTALTLAHRLGTPNIPRILRRWSTDPHPALRWTAVRAYAVAGEEFPHQALADLLEAARHVADDEQITGDPAVAEAAEIAESAAVLLLSDTGTPLLPALVPLLAERRTVRDLAQLAFLYACLETDGGEGTGRPLLLDRYVRARLAEEDVAAARYTASLRQAPTVDAPKDDYRHALGALWRSVLGDRNRTRDALEALRTWVRLADGDEAAEKALAVLLRTLVTGRAELQRLTHMLRTLRGADGGAPPETAARLLASLTASVAAP